MCFEWCASSPACSRFALTFLSVCVNRTLKREALPYPGKQEGEDSWVFLPPLTPGIVMWEWTSNFAVCLFMLSGFLREAVSLSLLLQAGIQNDRRSVLSTSGKNMPGCGGSRRSWAPWGCRSGSVRAQCMEGKEIKGVRAWIDSYLTWRGCSACSGRRGGCCACGVLLCLLFPVEGSARVAESRTALHPFCRSGTEILHAGKTKATNRAARLPWVNSWLNYKWIQTNPSPFNATFCCGGESNLPLGNWSSDLIQILFKNCPGFWAPFSLASGSSHLTAR